MVITHYFSLANLQKLFHQSFVFLVAFLLPLAHAFAQNETPLSIETIDSAQERILRTELLSAAEQAMHNGFYSLAIRFYTQAREGLTVNSTHWKDISLRLTHALLNKADISSASLTLDTISPSNDSRYLLCRAIIAQIDGRSDIASNDLKSIDPNQLSELEIPWLHLLKALIFDSQKNSEKSLSELKIARDKVNNEAQKARFEILIYRHHILKGRVNDTQLETLKKSMEAYSSQDTGFAFAREYAISLFKRGDTKKALEILEKQRVLARNRDTEDESIFLLLIASMGEINSPQTQLALDDVLRNGRGRLWQRMALGLLMQNADSPEKISALTTLLSDIINTSSQTNVKPHPLLDEIVFAKALLVFSENKLDEAAKNAQTVIDRYPGSAMRPEALKMLASIALRHVPPQYRNAANFLNQYRGDIPEGVNRARLSLLIGDCYFLNGDYSNASELYGQVLQNPHAQSLIGIALFQQVLADIRAKNLNSAETHLDAFLKSTKVPPLMLWQAEWNYIDALNKSGNPAQALKRTRTLLNNPLTTLPSELVLRLMWLDARLTVDTPEVVAVPKITDNILVFLDKLPTTELDENQRAILASNTLLLKGQALLKLNNETEALQTFMYLRSKYNGSRPSMSSYIDEARYNIAGGKLIEAQQRFIELADRYPTSEYTPVALYEAAITADQQGLQRTYEEAVTILERLLTKHPQNPIAFYARLKQGDILRKLNRFEAARSRYEEILKLHPDHPQKNEADMALAYTLLAQSRSDPTRLSQTYANLERIFDLPNLASEMRIEAGFQWAHALQIQGNLKRAEEVYWLVLTRFLLKPTQEYTLGVNGRYWLARTVFELATLWEKQNRQEDALTTYSLITTYQLPGIATALARIETIKKKEKN